MKAVCILPGWYSVTWVKVIKPATLQYHSVMVRAKSKYDATMTVIDQLIELENAE